METYLKSIKELGRRIGDRKSAIDAVENMIKAMSGDLELSGGNSVIAIQFKDPGKNSYRTSSVKIKALDDDAQLEIHAMLERRLVTLREKLDRDLVDMRIAACTNPKEVEDHERDS